MDNLESIQRALRTRSDVRLAYVFGSTARGEQHASSDVDVAVLFAPVPEARDLDRLTTDLAGHDRRRIDLVVLNTSPPLLAHEVISSGRLLVCRDEDERVSFEASVNARYLDTAHLRRVQHEYLRQRVEARRASSS